MRVGDGLPSPRDELYGMVARNGHGELCFFPQNLADGISLADYPALLQAVNGADTWHCPERPEPVPEGELRLVVDVTPEEARWLAERRQDDDRFGAFHTGYGKVVEAALAALGAPQRG